MSDPWALIISFLIVIFFLLLPLYLAKRIFPTASRLAQRLTKFLARPLIMTQAKRRGWIHTLTVHLPALSAVILTLIGFITGTWQVLVSALLCAVFALAAKRTLASLHRLRSHRSRLPGWRR